MGLALMCEWEACEHPPLEPNFYNPGAQLFSVLVLLRASCSFCGAAKRKHSGLLGDLMQCQNKDVEPSIPRSPNSLNSTCFLLSASHFPLHVPLPGSAHSELHLTRCPSVGSLLLPMRALFFLSQALSEWGSSFPPPQSATGAWTPFGFHLSGMGVTQ